MSCMLTAFFIGSCLSGWSSEFPSFPDMTMENAIFCLGGLVQFFVYTYSCPDSFVEHSTFCHNLNPQNVLLASDKLINPEIRFCKDL